MMRHAVVAQGPSSRHAAPGTFVIRTVEEWGAFWNHLPTRQAAPPIDFRRPSSPLSASDAPASRPVVVSVKPDRGHTLVTWRSEPAPASSAGHPFTVVALPEVVTTQMRFERQQ